MLIVSLPLSKSLLIFATALTLSACGGSSSSSNSDPSPQAPETKTLDSLVRTLTVQNEECPNGGIEVEMGIDANGNQRLDPSEVDHTRTQTICHGANGLDGENGADGVSGSNGEDGTNGEDGAAGNNGSSSLIAITAASSEECEVGGKKILIGIDLNANNVLDTDEVLQAEIICNQVINTETQIGSLVSTSAEQIGDNCAAGGVRIDTGLDSNGDQILAAGEIQSTNYICSGINGTNGQNGIDGSDGVDGQDGTDGLNGVDGVSNLDNLLIETIDEPIGSNCLHGGDKHRIGLDEDQDGILQEIEVISASFSCNANGAPTISFNGRETTIAGFEYTLTAYASDYNNSIYGSDLVISSVIEKPSWLNIITNENGTLVLSGVAEGALSDTHTVTISTTDGELSTQESFILTIVDGIQILASAADVVEGNLDAQGQTISTPGQFTVSLSKPASEVLRITYSLYSKLSLPTKGWSAENYSGVIEFSVGDTEKIINLSILSDDQYEVIENVELRLRDIEYSANELILLPSQNAVLNIINDDHDVIEFRADQVNSVPVLGYSDGGAYVQAIEFSNQPSWLAYQTDYFGHVCTDYTCFGLLNVNLTGEPAIGELGQEGQFEIIINLGFEQIQKTVKYIIVEGDKDNDGIINSLDAFPENPRGQTDSDDDGLGDEWEMANFESLILADGVSDFDANGITDKSAFENNTSIHEINFDFESGELPEGWVNTGNVNWVVSDTLSHDGQYGLTIEHALAPNETSRIEFEINSQSGELRLYAHAAEEISIANLSLYKEGGSDVGIYAPQGQWSFHSRSLSAGIQKLALTYSNHSATYNAPIIYIDSISGLLGIIPADRDGDGVLNADDLYPDRSDAATDTDEDGIADEWEQRYFGTLDRVTATSDFDNDGLLDINEFIQATNPSSLDSDNDGVSDGEDAFPSDSQYQTDTDNDGLADKWELAHFASLETSDGTQDSDGDLITDLAEFIAGTPPTPDTDGDGAADVVDAFPNNADYKLDNDEDGLADEWENLYGSTGYFSTDGDRDQDGRSDLKEFLEGTNPTQANLNAVEDILAVVQGQSITFNPAENDIASQGSLEGIITLSVSLPAGEQANFGSLQDNGDGTFSYTAAHDRLGWVRLNYVANDGESDANGEIFIHIVDIAPAQVVKIDGATSSRHSMALFSDGSLYAWGQNGQGQLGLGTTINNYVPTKVGGLPKIVDFSLGHLSIALAEDGTVWRWGGGVSIPSQYTSGMKAIAASQATVYLMNTMGSVAGLPNMKDIKAGYNHLLALGEDGTVWAKDSNNYGQLGYGQDTVSSGSFVQVSKLSNIVAIEAGGYQSFAIDADGQLFAWGHNGNIQLGDGTTINRNVPILISSLTNVAEVAAGYNHTLVRTEIGDLYGMGSVSGIYSSIPKKLTEEKVTSIGAGNNSSFYITEGGSSYSFGQNTNGQLGDGTTQNHSEPAEISWLLDGVVSESGKEGFEWNRIPPYWRNSGNNWEVVDSATASNVNTGSFAVKVKDRLTDSASASLGLQIATGAGDVSFSVKTSTEAEYDKLTFYVDGVEQASYSGVNDWVSSASFSVTAGVHSFEWIYHKDGGTSFGEDTVWIDDILLPIDSDGDGVIDREDATPYIPNPILDPAL